MIAHPLGKILGSLVCALLLGGALSSCSGDTWNPPPPAEREKPPLVAVSRGDIASVVTSRVSVVATPEYVVIAPTGGKVQYPKKPLAGEMVPEGTPLFSIDGEMVLAPRAGVVVERLQPAGLAVGAGVPVVAIRDGGFGVSGSVPVEAGYRITQQPHTARAQLDPGLGTFDCAPVHPRHSHPEYSADAPGAPQLAVLCLLEPVNGLMEGLSGTVGITMGEVHDVLVLPITAVSGRSEKGYVLLVDGTELRQSAVELGLSDGVVIEIRSGLQEGDEVVGWGPYLVPPTRT